MPLKVHGGRKSLGMMNALQYLYREGGIFGMWRGNGINIIKIAPESALKFAAYDVFKKLIK
jgi:solute carrier family 25 phosphate transporter 23/24/25/41